VNNANVLMHFAARLDDRQVDDLRAALAAVAGVARVEAGRKLRQLLLVDYDPRVVSAHALIDAVRDRGFAPRLVGM
jgi:copper chaperone CopZ